MPTPEELQEMATRPRAVRMLDNMLRISGYRHEADTQATTPMWQALRDYMLCGRIAARDLHLLGQVLAIKAAYPSLWRTTVRAVIAELPRTPPDVA